MIKCKLCPFEPTEKGEAAVMAELRKHWDSKHPKDYRTVKNQLAAHDNASRYCTTCGKSQLSAGYIDTCKRCMAWYCYDCTKAHAKCGKENTSRAVMEAA